MDLARKDEQQDCAHQTSLELCEPGVAPCPVFVLLAADQRCSTSLVDGNVCSCSATVVRSEHPYEPLEPT